MNVYATATQIKNLLGQSNQVTADDSLLVSIAVQSSRLIDMYTRRKFYPRYETKAYDHPVDYNRTLILFDDLLSVATLTTDSGDTTITSANYYLMRGDQYETPSNQIALNHSSNVWGFGDSNRSANSIVGIWGYHNDWGNAWAKIDDVQDSPLLVGGTSLTVADANGADEWGIEPRFQVGQLIRFGATATAEYAWITNVNLGTNVLTIVRGVNGSTAAEQANDVDIYVYRPQADIQQAAQFLGVHLYRRKDSVGSLNDQPVASPTGLILSQDLPREVRDMIKQYMVIVP